MPGVNDAQLAEEFVIRVDPELADRITTFLDRRRRDVKSLLEALDASDFQAIRKLARRIKDVGEGYGWFDHAHHPELVEGLDALTDMACDLEQAAKRMLAEEIHLCIHDLVAYLTRLKVRYT